MASLWTSVEHLIRNIDEFVLARVRRYRGKSKLSAAVVKQAACTRWSPRLGKWRAASFGKVPTKVQCGKLSR